jgi:hypothetical protein
VLVCLQRSISGKSLKGDQTDGTEGEEIKFMTPAGAVREFSLPLDNSLPHFYFHCTTAYDILRHCRVELCKRDYMGKPVKLKLASRLISRKKSRSDPTAEPIALHLHPVAFPVGNFEARASGGRRKNPSVGRGCRPDVDAGALQENDVLLLHGRSRFGQRGVSISASRPNRGSLVRDGGWKVGPRDRNRWIGRGHGYRRRSPRRTLGCGLCGLHGSPRLL